MMCGKKRWRKAKMISLHLVKLISLKTGDMLVCILRDLIGKLCIQCILRMKTVRIIFEVHKLMCDGDMIMDGLTTPSWSETCTYDISLNNRTVVDENTGRMGYSVRSMRQSRAAVGGPHSEEGRRSI